MIYNVLTGTLNPTRSVITILGTAALPSSEVCVPPSVPLVESVRMCCRTRCRLRVPSVSEELGRLRKAGRTDVTYPWRQYVHRAADYILLYIWPTRIVWRDWSKSKSRGVQHNRMSFCSTCRTSPTLLGGAGLAWSVVWQPDRVEWHEKNPAITIFATFQKLRTKC